MPHAINEENDKVLALNVKMIKENTIGPYEILYIGNMKRPELVYWGWDMLINAAKYEHVLWHNTDLLLAPNWDANIAALATYNDWISLRVVECGAISSYKTMISTDFGKTADTFDRKSFEEFVKQDTTNRSISEDGWIWYCPSVIKKSKYIELGGFDNTPIFPHPQDIVFKDKAIAANWKFCVSNHSYAYHLQRAHENLGGKDRT